jgi:hypothetical protein
MTVSELARVEAVRERACVAGLPPEYPTRGEGSSSGLLATRFGGSFAEMTNTGTQPSRIGMVLAV